MDEPGVAEHDVVDATLARMQADLLVARKARDQAAVTAIRTALAALANAEAPPVGEAAPSAVGRLVDHRRLVLTADDLDRILRHEIADRLDTIEQIRPHGRDAEIDELRAEIDVVGRYLA